MELTVDPTVGERILGVSSLRKTWTGKRGNNDKWSALHVPWSLLILIRTLQHYPHFADEAFEAHYLSHVSSSYKWQSQHPYLDLRLLSP